MENGGISPTLCGNSHILVGFDLDAKLVQKMPKKLEDALGEHREHRADQADSFKA